MDNILSAIRPTIDSYLLEYAKANLKEHNGIKILSIENVVIERLKNKDLVINKLYSGKEVDVFPEGSIRVLEDLGESKRTRSFNFWSQGMIVKYIADKEIFEITNPGSFKVFK